MEGNTTEREQIAWWRRVPWWGFAGGMAFAFGIVRFGQAEYGSAAINWLIALAAMAQAIQREYLLHHLKETD